MAPEPELDACLAAVAQGDRAAFARLYAATSPRLFAILLRTLGRRDWAEDALQEVYVRIWRKAASFDAGRASAMTWMASIARNRAIDLLRALPVEARHGIDGDAFADERSGDASQPPLPRDAALIVEDTLAQDTADEQFARRLRRALDRLEPRQRRAIELAFYDGYTHEELARLFDTPLGTVKGWIRRGLCRLRALVGEA